MPNSRLAVLPLIALALVSQAGAQAPAGRRVDSLMNAQMAGRLIPGAVVVVVQNGRVVKKTAYGLASVELNVPATTATLFQIASATKNVTGVAVMRLIEAGKFGLDDRIGDLLPKLPESWRGVTVRQILSHTSGLPDVVIDPETGVFLTGSVDSVLAQLAKMPQKPAGTEWSYNQTNYLLLGQIVDKFGGMPFRDYYQQRIFGPLGITGVSFGDSRLVVAGRASEYTRLRTPKGSTKLTDLKAFSYEYPDWLYTAAGVFMSGDDMGRWLQGIEAGLGLKPETFRTMTTTVSLNDGKPFHFPESEMGYGLGWIAMDQPQHRAVGGSGGGRATVLYYPDDHLGVAVLTNLQGAGPEELTDLVARQYLPPPPVKR